MNSFSLLTKNLKLNWRKSCLHKSLFVASLQPSSRGLYLLRRFLKGYSYFWSPYIVRNNCTVFSNLACFLQRVSICRHCNDYLKIEHSTSRSCEQKQLFDLHARLFSREDRTTSNEKRKFCSLLRNVWISFVAILRRGAALLRFWRFRVGVELFYSSWKSCFWMGSLLIDPFIFHAWPIATRLDHNAEH